MRLLRLAGGEDGLTLIELVIAALLMSVLVTSVGVSISVANDRSVTLSNQTNSIDQLQTAEETLTRDLHAANCFGKVPSSCASWSSPVPSSNSTSLSSQIGPGTVSSLPVHALVANEVVHAGDTIAVVPSTSTNALFPTTFVAACPTSGCTGSPATVVAGQNATSINVTPQNIGSSTTIASGSVVYDAGDVSLAFTSTLSGSSLKSAANGTVTSLTVGTLTEPVKQGDTLLVGTGSDADVFVASGAASAGSNVTIDVNSESVDLPAGSPLYDLTTGSDSTVTIGFQTNSDTSKTLEITFDNTTTTLLSNLDPTSGFFYKSASWTAAEGGATEGPYYTSVAINLTMDLPSVKAAHPTKTSLSDFDVIAQNIEYACQQAWSNYPAASGSLPC